MLTEAVKMYEQNRFSFTKPWRKIHVKGVVGL